MSRTLYLSPPSFDGFDGGAGARYQARREVTSYWYPTWLAQPAALTPNSKLLDCPPHNIGMVETLRIAETLGIIPGGSDQSYSPRGSSIGRICRLTVAFGCPPWHGHLARGF